MRRRITDAWARLGSLTPSAGLAAARRANRSSGAGPAAPGNPVPAAAGAAGKADLPARQPSPSRSKALVAGASVLAVVAVGGVIAAPKLFGGGSSDPGCQAYSSTALTAYNKAIDALNAQASQSALAADMSAATTDLTNAAGQARSATVKSALTGLLTELQTVNASIKSGSVPASTVDALNAASARADNAC
jgi:hypothetical protein